MLLRLPEGLKSAIPSRMRRMLRDIAFPPERARKLITDPTAYVREGYEPSEIDVHEARSEEYAEIGRLWVETFIGEGYTAPGQRAWLQAVATRAQEGTIFVAVYAQRTVLGSVMLVMNPSPLRFLSKDTEAEVRMLAVARSARGSGTGSALMQAVISAARESAKTGVVLCTDTEMKSAQRLYERLGFFRTSERDWSNPQLGRQFVAYRLELEAEASQLRRHCG